VIRATAKLTQPDDAPLEVTLTMTLGEWKRVLGVLDKPGGSYAAFDLAAALRGFVETVTQRMEEMWEAKR
jgi:hypothetical protein